MGISAERVHEVLFYDPSAGLLTWRKKTSAKPRTKPLAGKSAGSRNANGYLSVRIDRRLYMAHRIIWLLVHGWMPLEIDHINGDPSDNRLCNLRPAARCQQMQNTKRRVHNKSGIKGVHLHPQTGKWRVQMQCKNKRHHIGLYASKEEAAEAYMSAARRLFGEFATDGTRMRRAVS